MGRDRNLLRRYRAIISSCGVVLLIGGMVMTLPLPLLFFFSDESGLLRDFFIPALILLSAGMVLWKWIKPREEVVLTVQEGGLVVVAGWVMVCVVSAMPFVTGMGLTFNNALFEAVSGWTTTGLSVVDVQKAPRVMLLWRSVMQLAGGAGLAVI
ncbi:MAG TPA: TrkH family potassium uptake protein, partial [Spirochaetes bacterium]|nr:TrkH family potassium uptake protein [Spirochaetota bacterium]